MEIIEIRTIIKGFYVIITPVAGNEDAQEIAQNILMKYVGNEITEPDVLYARDEMSNQELIQNIKGFSLISKNKFINFLDDLYGKIGSYKSDSYCSELLYMLENSKTVCLETPNFNSLLEVEKRIGW
jgi:hypothetical protein